MIGLCGHRAGRGEVCERCATPHPRHVGGSANTGLRVVALPNWPGPLLAKESRHYCRLCGMSEGRHWKGCCPMCRYEGRPCTRHEAAS